METQSQTEVPQIPGRRRGFFVAYFRQGGFDLRSQQRRLTYWPHPFHSSAPPCALHFRICQPGSFPGRVRDLEDVYAAGDVTAFAVKQGGLAAQQAEAVAEAIAARAGAPVDPAPFRPVIRGLLLTGAEPIYLRAELRADGTAGVAAASGLLQPASASSDRPLWWPPAKVAGRYLAPYLATARPSRLEATALTDRPAPAGPAHPSERREALQLALSLADADAAWGDHASALRALEAAESLEGVLPPEYERKREAWRAALAE